MDNSFPLPLQEKPEREHLYRWITKEEEYVALKFNDQRMGHDRSLKENGLGDFWIRQVIQYYDRANAFLTQAKKYRSTGMNYNARLLELKAQQAIAKAMMTAKGLAESSIRVYGDLPKPGVPSGEIKKEW